MKEAGPTSESVQSLPGAATNRSTGGKSSIVYFFCPIAILPFYRWSLPIVYIALSEFFHSPVLFSRRILSTVA